ncbi:MAG TPA: hypothetical protein ENI62_08295 [Gammaproteobacteria bacterium]|nr:hypothetical protein [Gammaproteobacteria bacterium]
MENSKEPLSRDLQVKRMFGQLEHTILETNRSMIRSTLGKINNADFEAVAVTVARIRTLYLQQAIKLKDFAATEPLSNIDEMSELLVRLRRIRNAYEEAIAGYTAMQHAVERNYLAIETTPSDTSV